MSDEILADLCDALRVFYARTTSDAREVLLEVLDEHGLYIAGINDEEHPS